ncbi:MAG: hypothetical protein J0L63_11225 [Anaerolineae bacterium]|nr:hypothetical protein [Anaerolineae bacterium]MBN8619469.1 hypothetical protein [Anaerolineae bacterium]
MADERQQRLMQEALDQSLTPDLLQKLREQLDVDAESSQQFNRLRKVDEMLRSAPYERAPARLALSIMAKLAQTVKPQELSSASGLALALGMSMVVIVSLPVLIAASSLFLGALSSAAALNAIIQQIASLMALVVAMLDVLVKGAQSILATYPQAPLLMISVVPIILFWLLRAMRDEEDSGSHTRGG